MNLSKREQTLLLILIILLSFYLFNILLYQPLRQDTVKLTAENLKLKTLIENQQAEVERGQDWESERSKLEIKYQQMMVKLPEKAYLPETISYLEKSAEGSAVILQNINYHALPSADQQPGSSNAAKPCDFTLSARGSYYNLLTLLSKIEEAPRLYVINGVELIAPEVSPPIVEGVEIPASPQVESMPSTMLEGSNLVMRMQLTTYYDPASMSKITGMPEKIPPGEGKENPFQR